MPRHTIRDNGRRASCSAPAPERLHRARLVILWIDDHTAPAAFALAFGTQILLMSKGKVDHAAIARIHGREFIGGSGLAHLFRRYRSGHPQLFTANGF